MAVYKHNKSHTINNKMNYRRRFAHLKALSEATRNKNAAEGSAPDSDAAEEIELRDLRKKMRDIKARRRARAAKKMVRARAAMMTESKGLEGSALATLIESQKLSTGELCRVLERLGDRIGELSGSADILVEELRNRRTDGDEDESEEGEEGDASSNHTVREEIRVDGDDWKDWGESDGSYEFSDRKDLSGGSEDGSVKVDDGKDLSGISDGEVLDIMIEE